MGKKASHKNAACKSRKNAGYYHRDEVVVERALAGKPCDYYILELVDQDTGAKRVKGGMHASDGF